MTDQSKKAHYLGHRQRLKDRFLKNGFESLADYELLELFLFQLLPRADVKPLAKSLLSRFGTLRSLLNADEGLIREVDGAGPAVIYGLKVVQALTLTIMKEEFAQQTLEFSNWQSVVDYCKAAMGDKPYEELRLLFLDSKNNLIKEEIQQRGTIDHTPLYPREVIKRALELNSAAFIMVHNHPSGDPSPSKADIDLTIQVYEGAEMLGIELYDHLIIARKGHTSLKSLGLF